MGIWASDDSGRTWRGLAIDDRVLQGRRDEKVEGVHLKDRTLVLAGNLDDQAALWLGRLK